MKEKLLLVFNLFCFPFFFLINGVNENFGLIPLTVITSLLEKYFLITLSIILVCFLLMRDYKKTFVFSFFAICAFFMFGSFHDTIKNWELSKPLSSYHILMPFLFLFAFF